MAAYDRVVLVDADLRGSDLSALDPTTTDLRGAQRLDTDAVPAGYYGYHSWQEMTAAVRAREAARRGSSRPKPVRGMFPYRPWWPVSDTDRFLGPFWQSVA